ncbi:lysine 2,3-aminomutase [bacterium]|nr:lysine 2,3-aminomutase [bacterium]
MHHLDYLPNYLYNIPSIKYQAITLRNFKTIPQVQKLTGEQIFAIEVVGSVLPFKTNNYIVEHLIDWENIPDDPIYILNFPQKGMLKPHHFNRMADLIHNRTTTSEEIRKAAHEIRMELNPNPDGQIERNRPFLNGKKLKGMQHKYRETVLFFPSQGQTCHAYCTFCFRWSQFLGIDELRFAMHEADVLQQYLSKHTEVTDVLFTGGDPLIMKANTLTTYLDAIIDGDLPHIRNIRIGTKALTYWPYRFLSDEDADTLMAAFRKVIRSGRHLALMAHFNHPREMQTDIAQKAIHRLRQVGVEIRCQSPLLAHINDDPEVWAQLWKDEVRLGCIPYYMFIARDTGAQHYFGVPLHLAWQIFRQAYQKVSGLARTVRGPAMSSDPGKIQILGLSNVRNQKVFTLRFLQARNPDWVGRPFFARFTKNALWLNDLKPAFGNPRFFFQSP